MLKEACPQFCEWRPSVDTNAPSPPAPTPARGRTLFAKVWEAHRRILIRLRACVAFEVVVLPLAAAFQVTCRRLGVAPVRSVIVSPTARSTVSPPGLSGPGSVAGWSCRPSPAPADRPRWQCSSQELAEPIHLEPVGQAVVVVVGILAAEQGGASPKSAFQCRRNSVEKQVIALVSRNGRPVIGSGLSRRSTAWPARSNSADTGPGSAEIGGSSCRPARPTERLDPAGGLGPGRSGSSTLPAHSSRRRPAWAGTGTASPPWGYLR